MKLDTLVEIRDYLETIPEDKWIKEKYYGMGECACAVGHIAKERGTNTWHTENYLDTLSWNLSSIIERVNDDADNPKEAVINLLNGCINK